MDEPHRALPPLLELVTATGGELTALTIAPECRVAARVGNFTDLASQPFPIVARGG